MIYRQPSARPTGLVALLLYIYYIVVAGINNEPASPRWESRNQLFPPLGLHHGEFYNLVAAVSGNC